MRFPPLVLTLALLTGCAASPAATLVVTQVPDGTTAAAPTPLDEEAPVEEEEEASPDEFASDEFASEDEEALL